MDRRRVEQCRARLEAALNLVCKTLDAELLPAEEHLCISTAESLVRWSAQSLRLETRATALRPPAPESEGALAKRRRRLFKTTEEVAV